MSDNTAPRLKPKGFRLVDFISLLTVIFFGLLAWEHAQKLTSDNIILISILGIVMLRIVYELAFNRDGVPTLSAGPSERRKIAAVLKKDWMSRDDRAYSIIDLGSGTGELTRDIARAIPYAHVTGIELSKLPYLQARTWQRLFGPKNVEYKQLNFMPYPVSGADAVVMYLRATYMADIGAKLWRELKPGALVVSHTFQLPAPWQQVETVTLSALFKVMLYVYRR